MPGFVSWVLGIVSWVLGIVCWVPGIVFWVLGLVFGCLDLKAVIKSAASAASGKGGCTRSRLDHGLKFYGIQGGCARSRLISEFSDCAKSLT